MILVEPSRELDKHYLEILEDWNNRRLKERLAGSRDRIEFPAEMETKPVFNGLGLMMK